jgi:methyl-accepting chemotaxis protein
MVLYRVVSRVQARVDGIMTRVEPIIDTAKKLAEENAPKISSIATSAVGMASNAKDISDVAKEQAHRFAEVGRDLADRTKAQIARVDAAVDETVDNVQHVGENVKTVVMRPVKEASAVLAGVKAAVASVTNGRRPTMDHITQDEEMFI